MRRLIPALLLFASACATAPAPTTTPRDETLRYTVLSAASNAGQQIVVRRGNELTIDYEYNDRGRGPKMRTVMRLDERGLPVSVHTTGHDYLKAPVEETFSVDGGTATWKSPIETGTARAGGFYLPFYAPPQTFGLLARALLAEPDKTLPLLPMGEARITKAGELTLGDRRVHHYEIVGLDAVPLDIFLDDNHDFFAFVEIITDIRAGYESHLKTLQQAQEKRKGERLREIAQRHTKTPANGTLQVRNARIFDPVTLRVSEPSTIEVEGNRIVRVTTGTPASARGEVIDAAGRLVIPGLWDSHAHLGEADGVFDIAAGVTGVHDVGNSVDKILTLKREYGNGTLIGPRILSRPLIDGPGPLQAPTDLLVANEDEARAMIDRLANLGFEGIKIYSSIKPELIPFMTRYAHEKGLRASGHIPAGMTASQAIDAGYDEIHHINMLFLNFWPDVKETNSPLRFTAVAERGPALDLKSAEVQAFIRKLKETDTTVDPTLTVFEWLFVARPGELSPTYQPIAERLPPQYIRFNKGGGLPVTPETDARNRAAFRKMLDFVAELHRNGVRVVSGTDLLSGLALHRELELYAEAGIPNAEVLRISTWNLVQMLGLEKDLGTIEAGKLADFAIVDGDPLQRMRDIRNIVTVVKDGKIYDSAALFREVSVRYAKVQ